MGVDRVAADVGVDGWKSPWRPSKLFRCGRDVDQTCTDDALDSAHLLSHLFRWRWCHRQGSTVSLLFLHDFVIRHIAGTFLLVLSRSMVIVVLASQMLSLFHLLELSQIDTSFREHPVPVRKPSLSKAKGTKSLSLTSPIQQIEPNP